MEPREALRAFVSWRDGHSLASATFQPRLMEVSRQVLELLPGDIYRCLMAHELVRQNFHHWLAKLMVSSRYGEVTALNFEAAQDYRFRLYGCQSYRELVDKIERVQQAWEGVIRVEVHHHDDQRCLVCFTAYPP